MDKQMEYKSLKFFYYYSLKMKEKLKKIEIDLSTTYIILEFLKSL